MICLQRIVPFASFVLLALGLVACDAKVEVTHTPATTTVTHTSAPLPSPPAFDPTVLMTLDLTDKAFSVPARVVLVTVQDRLQLLQSIEEVKGTVQLAVKNVTLTGPNTGVWPRFEVHMGLATDAKPDASSLVGVIEAKKTAQSPIFEVTDPVKRILKAGPGNEIAFTFVPVGDDAAQQPTVTLTGVTLKVLRGDLRQSKEQ